MSTYSNLKIEEITLGDSGWGTSTTNNLLAIQQALQSATLVNGTNPGEFSSNVATLPWNNTSATTNTPRAMILNITATLSGTGTLNLPAISGGKLYLVANNSAGGNAVTVKVTGQTGISVPSGKAMWLWNNGIDVVDAVNYISSLTLGTALPIASGGTGQITANAALNALLPSQGGNAGKYLETDGTNSSWSLIDAPTGLTGSVPVANGGTGGTTQATGRTGLGLGTISTQDSSAVDISGGLIYGTRISQRVVVIPDSTIININADITDMATQANTQGAGTLTIGNPTGTIGNGQKLLLRLRSSNVQTFSWGASFAGSSDLPLPSASSGSNKFDYMGFIWNSTVSQWQLAGKVFGF